MTAPVFAGILLLLAIGCAAIGAWLLLPAAGWITIGAGLAYLSWSITRGE